MLRLLEPKGFVLQAPYAEVDSLAAALAADPAHRVVLEPGILRSVSQVSHRTSPGVA